MVPSSAELEKLDTLIQMLKNNPALALTAAEAARLINFSPLRLKQTFKQHTGITIQQFITKAKMEKAAALLLHDIPIKLVSSTIGYSDVTSFYRTFCKYHQCTPGAYKRDRKPPIANN